MDKALELLTLDRLITAVLKKYPETRNSDLTLYLKLCELINPEAMQMPFGYVMAHSKEYGLPNYESVGRARRKAQENNSELQAVETVKEKRQRNIAIFQDYARGLLCEIV